MYHDLFWNIHLDSNGEGKVKLKTVFATPKTYWHTAGYATEVTCVKNHTFAAKCRHIVFAHSSSI